MSLPVGPRNIQQLVDGHYEALYRYAYRLTGSSADAEDLTQETFCKAQSKQEQLRDTTAAKSWLFSILRNAYLHRIRTDRRQLSLEDVGELAEPLPDPLPPIEPERLQQALN